MQSLDFENEPEQGKVNKSDLDNYASEKGYRLGILVLLVRPMATLIRDNSVQGDTLRK